MSSLSSSSLPKPKDWQDFERKARDLFACALADPETRMNGRLGQPQQGVDIWGYRREDRGRLVGVQCKRSSDPITVVELEGELNKAKNFQPPITEFILVTTAQRDTKIQECARRLTEELAQSPRPIVVAVWGWEDIEECAANYTAAWRAFDPTYNPFVEEAHRETLAKLDDIRREMTPLADRLLVDASAIKVETSAIREALERLFADNRATDLERTALEDEINRLRSMSVMKDRAIETFLNQVGVTPLEPEGYPDQLRQFANYYQKLLAEAQSVRNEGERSKAKERVEAGELDEADEMLHGATYISSPKLVRGPLGPFDPLYAKKVAVNLYSMSAEDKECMRRFFSELRKASVIVPYIKADSFILIYVCRQVVTLTADGTRVVDIAAAAVDGR